MQVKSSPPRALVYRGPATTKECANSVAQLLRDSPSKFEVTFVGPNEHIKKPDLSTLRGYDMYAQPGGGGECHGF